MAEEDFHIRQVISNLTDSLEELESRTNTLESSIPQKIEYLINQNPDGSWSREKIVSEISQTPLQIKNKLLPMKRKGHYQA